MHMRFFSDESHHLLSSSRYRIAIVGGTGAVGAYFVYLLLKAGHYVSIIGKNNSGSLHQVQKKGLELYTSEGTVKLSPEQFSYIGTAEDFPKDNKQDLVILSVKQYDMSADLAERVVAITDKNSVIGVITNGLPFYFLRGLGLDIGHLESLDEGGKISKVFEDRMLMSIQPVIAAQVISPGVIKITRPLATITVTIGAPEERMFLKLMLINKMFNEASIKTTYTESGLHKNILEKLQFAQSINTLSALLEKNIGYVFSSKETQAVILYVLALLDDLAYHLKIGPLRTYAEFKALKITNEHFSSLYHDFQVGKPGEIKAIVDSCIELGELLQGLGKSLELSLEPLEMLRSLLILKSNKQEVSQSALNVLFESCHLALVGKVERPAIRSKL